ncbi:PKD domain-containing protein [Emticicia sp. 17c]|uniref:PKD domain-containing protein n=1 Tax=Emticicia sp. 17c TaxID=3127704 RepID=UPI00301D8271
MKITSTLWALLLLVGSTLVSCKETEETPKPTPDIQLKAQAGPDQDVLPTKLVTLDGSASTGKDSKTFNWIMIRKPSNSDATLAQANTAKPNFTPDIVGYYEFELTVTDGSEKSQDRIKIKAEYTEPITLDKPITSKTRLFDRFIDPVKADYLVTKDIPVSAELTIDQGVTMAFDRDKSLSIEEKGTISALGVIEQRIRFTGIQAQKSYWAGIKLYSPSTANALAFVDIEFGGSKIAFTNTKAGLAMFGNNKAQISLTDCNFTSNDGYGLYVQNGSVFRAFARNSFAKQTEAGILIDAYNATLLDAASKFTGGNGRDVVEISSSDIKDGQNVSWSAFADKTPYRLLGNMAIETGWTLKPGVIVEVARDAMISINRNGYLSAKGTADNKVLITGSSRNTTHWRGIIVYSVSALNVIENAEVSGGGSTVIVSGKKATVTAYGKGAKVSIKNTRISNGGGYGIMYTSDAEINADAASANTFAANAGTNLYKL